MVSWRKKRFLLWLGGTRLLLKKKKNLEGFSFQGTFHKFAVLWPCSLPVRKDDLGLNRIITEKTNLCSLSCSSLCMALLWAKE